MKDLPKTYSFDDFRFDAARLALYHRDRLVKVGDRKTMQVLAILLRNPNRLTTHDEIIEEVWHENPLGITSGHIGQYISKLRKMFGEFGSELNYIETVKGRGYLFNGKTVLEASGNHINPTAIPSGSHSESPQRGRLYFSDLISIKTGVILLVIACSILAIVFLNKRVPGEEDEIRRIVKESQLFESLIVYKNPSAFRETDLDRYWTPELDINANFDRQRIREAVKKLNSDGRRYGDETKCEQFDFQSVEINQNQDIAVVKTLEKWFISVYFNDGTLQRNKYVGPYFVSYIVRKINGRWLIEKSSTARMNRPTPRLTEISAPSEIKARNEFFVRITGQDFEPETVYVEITGEGCPESKPCQIPNSILRQYSKLSETVLDHVPLTLASGVFHVTIRNGESQPSNSVILNVP